MDDQDYDHLMQWKWHAAKGGKYAGRRPRSGAVYMHSVIARRMGMPAGTIPDHRNGDGLDNRRSNLRPATNQTNLMNRGPQVNNTSGFKGVIFDKRSDAWRAQIKVDGRYIYLGCFDSKIEAAEAYNEAATKFFGEFAWLNPIRGKTEPER